MKIWYSFKRLRPHIRACNMDTLQEMFGVSDHNEWAITVRNLNVELQQSRTPFVYPPD